MDKKWMALSLPVIMLYGLTACAPKGEEKKPIGNIKEVIDVKCSACHFSSRIFDNPQPAERWVDIVHRMRAMNPDIISEEEANEMIKYLQANNGLKDVPAEAAPAEEPAAEPESVPGADTDPAIQ